MLKTITEEQILPNLSRVKPTVFKSVVLNEKCGIAQIVLLILAKNNKGINQKLVVEQLLKTGIYDKETSANAAVSRNIEKLSIKKCVIKDPGNNIFITTIGLQVVDEYLKLAILQEGVSAELKQQITGKETSKEADKETQQLNPSTIEEKTTVKEGNLVNGDRIQDALNALSSKIELEEDRYKEFKNRFIILEKRIDDIYDRILTQQTQIKSKPAAATVITAPTTATTNSATVITKEPNPKAPSPSPATPAIASNASPTVITPGQNSPVVSTTAPTAPATVSMQITQADAFLTEVPKEPKKINPILLKTKIKLNEFKAKLKSIKKH